MLDPDLPAERLPRDFDGWWNLPAQWIEEPNVRRAGWSGMATRRIGGTLYFIKKQNDHCYRSLAHPFGRPTTEREYANICRLTALGIRVPEPVFHASRKTPDGFLGLLVTRELAGFKALDDLGSLPPAARLKLAAAVGHAAGSMHRAKLQHSCFYGKHVMARWPEPGIAPGDIDPSYATMPEVAFIDLEKLRRPPLPWRAAAHDLSQLRRHQHLWNADEWAQLLTAHRAALHGQAGILRG